MEWQVTIGIALAVSSIFSFVPVWFDIALLHSLSHSLGDYRLSVVILVLVSKSALVDFSQLFLYCLFYVEICLLRKHCEDHANQLVSNSK
jgi:hypothetical protein